MALRLIPCPACRRHVRAAERACPFCGASVPADLADSAESGEATLRSGVLLSHRTRFASVVFGVALSTTSVASAAEADDPEEGGAASAGGGAMDAGGAGRAGAATGGAGGAGGAGTGGAGGSAGDANGEWDDDGSSIPHYGAPGCDLSSDAPGEASGWVVASALWLAALRRRRRSPG